MNREQVTKSEIYRRGAVLPMRDPPSRSLRRGKCDDNEREQRKKTEDPPSPQGYGATGENEDEDEIGRSDIGLH
jgi:hypothetical protein